MHIDDLFSKEDKDNFDRIDNILDGIILPEDEKKNGKVKKTNLEKKLQAAKSFYETNGNEIWIKWQLYYLNENRKDKSLQKRAAFTKKMKYLSEIIYQKTQDRNWLKMMCNFCDEAAALYSIVKPIIAVRMYLNVLQNFGNELSNSEKIRTYQSIIALTYDKTKKEYVDAKNNAQKELEKLTSLV